MNALIAAFSTARFSTFRPQLAPVARPVHRERAIGVGYGSSSGYAATPRYTSAAALPRFRVV